MKILLVSMLIVGCTGCQAEGSNNNNGNFNRSATRPVPATQPIKPTPPKRFIKFYIPTSKPTPTTMPASVPNYPPITIIGLPNSIIKIIKLFSNEQNQTSHIEPANADGSWACGQADLAESNYEPIRKPDYGHGELVEVSHEYSTPIKISRLSPHATYRLAKVEPNHNSWIWAITIGIVIGIIAAAIKYRK